MGRHDVKTRVLRLFTFFLTLTLLWGAFTLPCFAAVSMDKTVDTYAKCVYMLSLDTREPLYDKASTLRCSPASLTKIMTALVVIECCPNPESQTITVPNNALFSEIHAEGGVTIQLQAGETLTVKDLLCAIMLPSACDAAELLAWHFGNGDSNNFANAMNQRCQALGLENTYFGNAHGLDLQNSQNYSCAADMAVIAAEAMKLPLFQEIISTFTYTIPATNKAAARTMSYTISMLDRNNKNYYYEGMKGVKTGYTRQAGRCLVSTASRDGASYLLVVMGANLDDQQSQSRNLAYDDTKALYDYAFQNFEVKSAVAAGQSYGSVAIQGGTRAQVDLVAKEDRKVLCFKNAQLRYEMTAPKTLTAPVLNESVGTLKIYAGDDCLTQVDLVPQQAVAAVAPVTTQKGSLYTGSAQGNIFTNDPVTVILLLSLAVTVLLAVLFTTLFRLAKNARKR